LQSSTSENIIEQISTTLDRLHSLTILREVLHDSLAATMLTLLRELAAPESDATIVANAYSKLFHELAQASNSDMCIRGIPDAWQAYLISRIVDDTNPLSTQAEHVGAARIAPNIYTQARHDLLVLQSLCTLTAQLIWETVRRTVVSSLPALYDAWVPWENLAPSHQDKTELTARDRMGQRMATGDDWGTLVDELVAYWSRHGTGVFARYHVLRWQGREDGLQGIAYPDPIRLDGLIGYEREHTIIKRNTERFLQGVPAHDTVLYGAPGTGKSSTVKALANAYADRGLRLIEVRKDMVNDLPAIVAQLRGRAPRFLLFIDDLSFEDHETEYKALKVLLEGAVEARPRNILIYVTSNRLNLIRENFSDRGKPADDVHWRDTMEEKNSLVARFGLRVTFALPNQERYLKIATELAHQRGITMPDDDIRARALDWERQHSGRSGRLARQFVDELEALWKSEGNIF
jgi:predicted AAA+ superfamily ATPase